jgi:hypothetical protein
VWISDRVHLYPSRFGAGPPWDRLVVTGSGKALLQSVDVSTEIRRD